jgi:hypothetical protein
VEGLLSTHTERREKQSTAQIGNWSHTIREAAFQRIQFEWVTWTSRRAAQLPVLEHRDKKSKLKTQQIDVEREEANAQRTNVNTSSSTEILL